MSFVTRFARSSIPLLNRYPRLKEAAKAVDIAAARVNYSVAALVPAVMQPSPRQLTIAVTAHCNLRCAGCRYGRDFMKGEQLSLAEVKEAFEDAYRAGVSKVRLYGGEPLLHPELAQMVKAAKRIGLSPYVTSNGILLNQKVDALYEAGLRLVTIGFYGFDVENVSYAGRSTYAESLERSLSYVRDRYGSDIELQLNFVAMGPTCRGQIWREAWALAKKYDMYFHIDLSSYSTPFFIKDSEAGLGVLPGDQPWVDLMVRELLEYKDKDPKRFLHSHEFIRSIPDWLFLGADMRVPCDANQHLWIGADGTVQLCDTAFVLGNIKSQRLESLLFSKEHRNASVEAFQLKCPNCTCRAEGRIQKHAASLRKYQDDRIG